MNIQSPSQLAASQRPSQPALGGYMSGFGNGFETEALPGALPIGRNSPQNCAYGLYAEQLSGSPFTAPRTSNERTWLYRIRPTVAHWGTLREGRYRAVAHRAGCTKSTCRSRRCAGTRSRSRASRSRSSRASAPITTAGDAGTQAGMGAHVYLVTRSMQDEYFYNADGEMLFVPQQGSLRLWTEFGIIDIEPGEIARHPARRQDPRRAARRPGARLSVRELRRRLHAARARPDRRQLPGQPARLPHARRGLRGPRRALAACS